MERSSPIRAAAGLLVWTALCLPALIVGQVQGTPSVRRVQVLGNRNPVEIEIEASDRLVPQTQLLTGPDRLVVDFPNAVPGLQLRNQKVGHGEVKGVRVSLFSAKPPVTRLVFDLKGPQSYQVFPYGRTVMVKVGAGAEAAKLGPAAISASGIASRPGLVNTSYPAQSSPISVSVSTPAPPPLVVSFQAGLLTISSNKASLSEILFAVHQRTGAEIAIPAGAEQEQVVADLGPASAPEVLAHLLNGSKFNFLILSSAADPSLLDRVILSERPEGAVAASRPLPQIQPQEDVDDAAGRGAPPPPVDPGNQPQPTPPPDTKPPSGNDTPD
jgi:hypothetical protein